MRKNVKVDSLNLSSHSFEHLFTNSKKYEILTIEITGQARLVDSQETREKTLELIEDIKSKMNQQD